MRVFLCPSTLYLWEQISYNVGMKDKELKIKVDDQFIEKVDYLQRINDFKNRSDTVRKVVEKEYRKETMIPLDEFVIKEEDNVIPVEGLGNVMPFNLSDNPIVAFTHRKQCDRCLWQNTTRCKVFGKGINGELGCSFKKRWEKEDGR